MVEQLVLRIGPELTFIALLAGMWLAVTALYIPGTGLPEGAALAFLSLAAIGLVQFPVNLLGMLLMLGALACLGLLMAAPRRVWLTPLAFAMQLAGSLLLFSGEARSSVVVVMLANVATLFYHVLVIMPGLRTQRMAPRVGDGVLIGAEGVVIAKLDPEGAIRVMGETWQASIDGSAERGQRVRVTGRDGLHLRVVPVEGSTPDTPHLEYRPGADASEGLIVGGLNLRLSQWEAMVIAGLVLLLLVSILLLAIGAREIANALGAVALVGLAAFLVGREWWLEMRQE